ncbi:MAG: hypothetical protein JWR27_49 [Aeromicrobium sp.]|jgi:hypothetical protein|nr:hypothetical protein [Aeromicrobium sp.]
MFKSRFMPCQACGASVDRSGRPRHECLPERRTDFEMFGLRDEIAQLEVEVSCYLATASGRFSSWLAARQVRRRS